VPKVAIYNMSGAQIGELELNEAVFGITPNQAVLHQFIKMQLNNRRVGTASTKTRSEVRGGGRKPWRQKGTGRARVGSTRNPLWRKGGVVFGPRPRDYSYTLPRKVRRLAMKSALSGKVLDNNMIVLDELRFDLPKTKAMLQTLDSLNIDQKALVVVADDHNVIKSARNIPGVKPLPVDYINVYDLMNYDILLITKDAVARIEEVFA
jgi:large subunit ribosomal protein L4